MDARNDCCRQARCAKIVGVRAWLNAAERHAHATNCSADAGSPSSAFQRLAGAVVRPAQSEALCSRQRAIVVPLCDAINGVCKRGVVDRTVCRLLELPAANIVSFR